MPIAQPCLRHLVLELYLDVVKLRMQLRRTAIYLFYFRLKRILYQPFVQRSRYLVAHQSVHIRILRLLVVRRARVRTEVVPSSQPMNLLLTLIQQHILKHFQSLHSPQQGDQVQTLCYFVDPSVHIAIIVHLAALTPSKPLCKEPRHQLLQHRKPLYCKLA